MLLLVTAAINVGSVPAATFVLDSIVLEFDTIKLTIVYAFIVFVGNDLPLLNAIWLLFVSNQLIFKYYLLI